MKNRGSASISFPSRALILILLVAGTWFASGVASARATRAGTGQVIVLRELQLKPGASVAEFERFVLDTFNPTWQGAAPGLKGYIARGDRGVKKGGYAFVMVFDSEKTRNAMYPTPGGDVSEKFMPMMEKPLGLAAPLEKWVDTSTIGIYTDYVEMR
jgi:hypothetical protein